MEKVKEPPIHNHPLIPFTRFTLSECDRCNEFATCLSYIYGGYRCNELGCDDVVFHKECAKPLQEINHSSHPDHPLKLIYIYLNDDDDGDDDDDEDDSNGDEDDESGEDDGICCTLCGCEFKVGYWCSICAFKLDLKCARKPAPLVLPANTYGHEHPLELSREVLPESLQDLIMCKGGCDSKIHDWKVYSYYTCQECEYFIHLKCLDVGPEAYHTCHPQHPLKGCMGNPPPVPVECPTTHEHQLHLVPRLIDFTCNACGPLGVRSPYFCLVCNFIVHRECIGLPRLININRHDHRISYTPRLGGLRERRCGVCHQNVNGFHGAYTCAKCPGFVVHSRCATREDVWDMIELEGTPEEEEIAPFEVIDANTIRHFSHDHNLQINKDGIMLPESTLCQACVLQISSESFYGCDQCNFTLHEKCAYLPRKKRHVFHNRPFTLCIDSQQRTFQCKLCFQAFTGFRYESDTYKLMDVRCGSVSEPFEHESHPHPLYYTTDDSKSCSECGEKGQLSFDECEFSLDLRCAMLPRKVMRHRYDDHPLFLSYGESGVCGEYWCEACETKLKPGKWFYTCNVCGVVLHISCVVGDYPYILPGTSSVVTCNDDVEFNTSVSRPLCFTCKARCKLPSVHRFTGFGTEGYICSSKCETIESSLSRRRN